MPPMARDAALGQQRQAAALRKLSGILAYRLISLTAMRRGRQP
jgi:hypothetical protein